MDFAVFFFTDTSERTEIQDSKPRICINEEFSRTGSECRASSVAQVNGLAACGWPRCTPKLTGCRQGRLGQWVSLRVRLRLAGRALQVHALFIELELI